MMEVDQTLTSNTGIVATTKMNGCIVSNIMKNSNDSEAKNCLIDDNYDKAKGNGKTPDTVDFSNTLNKENSKTFEAENDKPENGTQSAKTEQVAKIKLNSEKNPNTENNLLDSTPCETSPKSNEESNLTAEELKELQEHDYLMTDDESDDLENNVKKNAILDEDVDMVANLIDENDKSLDTDKKKIEETQTSRVMENTTNGEKVVGRNDSKLETKTVDSKSNASSIEGKEKVASGVHVSKNVFEDTENIDSDEDFEKLEQEDDEVLPDLDDFSIESTGEKLNNVVTLKKNSEEDSTPVESDKIVKSEDVSPASENSSVTYDLKEIKTETVEIPSIAISSQELEKIEAKDETPIESERVSEDKEQENAETNIVNKNLTENEIENSSCSVKKDEIPVKNSEIVVIEKNDDEKKANSDDILLEEASNNINTGSGEMEIDESESESNQVVPEVSTLLKLTSNLKCEISDDPVLIKINKVLNEKAKSSIETAKESESSGRKIKTESVTLDETAEESLLECSEDITEKVGIESEKDEDVLLLEDSAKSSNIFENGVVEKDEEIISSVVKIEVDDDKALLIERKEKALENSVDTSKVKEEKSENVKLENEKNDDGDTKMAEGKEEKAVEKVVENSSADDDDDIQFMEEDIVPESSAISINQKEPKQLTEKDEENNSVENKKCKLDGEEIDDEDDIVMLEEELDELPTNADTEKLVNLEASTSDSTEHGTTPEKSQTFNPVEIFSIDTSISKVKNSGSKSELSKDGSSQDNTTVTSKRKFSNECELNESTDNTEKAAIEKVVAADKIFSDNSDNAQDKFGTEVAVSRSNSEDSNLLKETISPACSSSNLSQPKSCVGPPSKKIRTEGEKDSEKEEDDDVVLLDIQPAKDLIIPINDDLSSKSLKRPISPSCDKQPKKPKVFIINVGGKLSASETAEPAEEKLKTSPATVPDSCLLKQVKTAPKLKVPRTNLSLDFLKRFKKQITEMTKQDLEEFVLQKVAEVILTKSELTTLRDLVEKQDKIMATHRNKTAELTKQFNDLEMVHKRVLKDLEAKNQQFVMPVKITRAVGLQVLIPKKSDFPASTLLTPAKPAPQPSTSNHAPQTAPAGPSTSGEPPKRRSNQKITPMRPVPESMQPQTSQQQLKAMPTLTPRPQETNMTSIGGKVVYKTVTKSIGPQTAGTAGQQQMQRLHQIISPPTQQQQQAAVAAAARKPMTQQQRNQQQHQQMMSIEENNNVNNPASFACCNQIEGNSYYDEIWRDTIRKARLRQNSVDFPASILSNDSDTENSIECFKSGKQSSPPARVVENSHSSAQKNSPSPGPQQTQERRVPPVILKKSTTNTGRITSATGLSPLSSTTQTPNTSAAGKSFIDLTDEDDQPKSTTAGGLPALVAIPNKPGPASQASRVTYVVNKPNAPPQRVTVAQNVNVQAMQRQHMAKAGTQYITIAPKQTSQLMPQSSLNATRIQQQAHFQQQQQLLRSRHPAPLPKPPTMITNHMWKLLPPRPSIRINNIESGIVISWTMDDMSDHHAEVVSYQIYAYQETSAPPQVEAWRHVGDVKSMLLPMAVTLTQFQEGQRYYFAVRAVDRHSRYGPFSLPKTWV